MSEDDYEPDDELSIDEKNMAMLAHLGGLLAVSSAGLVGFVVPAIIWLTRKKGGGFAGTQAKESLNFQISVAIYFIVCIPLMFIVIGFILLAALIIFEIVFVIVASIEANKGERYRYPLTIRFIK